MSKNKTPDFLWKKLISGEVIQTFNNDTCIAQDFITYSSGITYEDTYRRQIAVPKHDYFEPEMVQPTITPKTIDQSVKKSILQILDYLESEECKSYEEQYCENQEADLIPTNKLKKGHIYTEIRKVRDWLDNRK